MVYEPILPSSHALFQKASTKCPISFFFLENLILLPAYAHVRKISKNDLHMSKMIPREVSTLMRNFEKEFGMPAQLQLRQPLRKMVSHPSKMAFK